jgi:hypothetical protein
VPEITATTPAEAISEVQRACEDGEIMNLTVSFPMQLPASTSLALQPFREEALRWQAPTRHNSLVFNHGEYMHAHGDPIGLLEGELKRKATSNRACLSLVSSESIFSSEDGILPSFLLVQAGFSGPTRDLLYMTAYYRALEVSSFLAVNITELALMAEGLADRLPWFDRVMVTMHAFRAHSKPGFTAHRRSSLDRSTPAQLHALVEQGDLRRISEMLREKSAPASIIDDSGLTALRIEAEEAGWSAEVQVALDKAISALRRLKSIRAAATHGHWVDRVEQEFSAHVNRAAQLVSEE